MSAEDASEVLPMPRTPEQLRADIINDYRAYHHLHHAGCTAHLPHCPDVQLVDLNCMGHNAHVPEPMRAMDFEAKMICPHGETEWHEWVESDDDEIDELMARWVAGDLEVAQLPAPVGSPVKEGGSDA